MRKVCRKILFSLCFLTGCAPATLDDLRCQGEAETEGLATFLREIETKEDLEKALPRLKKKFNRLALILQEVRKTPHSLGTDPSVASEELFIELSRLYEIPGCRDLVERAEDEAIEILQR